MLLCNKQDLPDALSESEIAVQFNASKIKSVPFRLQLISALNG
jgi:signal recognition particle receptor subunit beta